MSITPFTQPDYTAQSGSQYPTNIDNAIAVLARMGANFAPQAQNVPNMTIKVNAGVLWTGAAMTEVAAQNTGTITAPAADPRIDRVVIDATDGTVSVITGAEDAAPVAPALTDNKIPVAQIALTVGMTEITNADITDERPGFFMRRATQAQAEAGLSEGLLMDPLRVAQAIVALAPSPPSASNSEEGLVEKATAAEMEAETADKYPDAALIKRSPGVAKCHATVNVSGGTPSLSTNYNITSITDTSTGRLTITIGTNFSGANWAHSAAVLIAGGTYTKLVASDSKTNTSILLTMNNSAGTAEDPDQWSFTGHGDQ